MRITKNRVAAAVCVVLSACASGHEDAALDDDVVAALDTLPGAEVTAARDGVPTFLAGELGHLEVANARIALPALVGRIAPAFRLAATDLRLVGIDGESSGELHARYQQMQYGLDVEGAELLVHVDRRGVIYAANGSARGGAAPSMATRVAAGDAVAGLLATKRWRGMRATPAQMAFVLDGERRVRLAWRTTVSGERDGEPVEDRVFVDARAGGVAAVLPQVQPALSRSLHTVNNGQIAPGILRRAEGAAASGDTVVDDVYEHLGTTFGCYQALFARDSYDGKGGALTGVVHYGVNLRNAFYSGDGLLIFGDGDGRNDGAFGSDLDIVAHELTHGVTRETSNLRYADDSGAINEAMSDVFGAICETWKRGRLTADTWKIGEKSHTPNVPNDALRYMDNPTLDGISRDFYPERYSGTQDNGGVHFNSGIANLAFYLLTAGGTHPRGKSDVTVPALGLERAGRIFYRANTTYLTSTSQYPDLRAATMRAAKDLFGDAERDAVGKAWTAVGVGDPGRPVPPSSPVTQLTPGGERQLSGMEGDERLFAVDVPAGAKQLAVELSGGSGDVDLFIKRDGSPTLYGSDHVSANLGSTDERVFVAAPPAGRYYLLVTAASDYAGVTLRTRTAGSAAESRLAGGRWVTLAGDRKAARTFTVEVPAGSAGLSVELDGEGGDSSLYVRRGAPASAQSHDAVSATSGTSDEAVALGGDPGVYHILVEPAAGAEGFDRAVLRATFLPATTLRAGDEVAVSGSAGSAQLFVIDVSAPAALLEIALHGGTGDADVFLAKEGPPTDRRFERASYNPENEELIVLPRAAAGRYYLAVYAASAFDGATLSASVLPALHEAALSAGHAATVAFGPTDPLRFSLEVPATAIDGSVSFAGKDVEVYLSRGGLPTATDHELSTEGKAEKRLDLAPLAAGVWHVLLVAAGQTTGRLTGSVNATPALREARPLVLSGTAGSQKVLRFDATTAGARFSLTGGAGDADLYVKKDGVPTVENHDAKSDRPGNDETVTLASGPGTYYVLVVAAQEYSLGWLTAAALR